jgi:hypothetical protein
MNLRHFETIYKTALERSRIAGGAGFSPERAHFQTRYEQYIALQAAIVSRQLSSLDHAAEELVEAAS